MANTRMTQRIRDDIEEEVRKILAAPIDFLKCPLDTFDARSKLWQAFFPKSFWELLRAVRREGFEVNAQSGTGKMFTIIGEQAYYIHFQSRDVPTPNYHAGFHHIPKSMTREWKFYDKASQFQPWDQIAAVVGELAEPLKEWLTTAATLAAETGKARDTIHELLKMSQTAGQLKRMVPELLPYLSEEKRLELTNQVRASTLPFEWAAFDRQRVADAMTTISKCHLIKGATPTTQSHSRGSSMDDVMWAFPISHKDLDLNRRKDVPKKKLDQEIESVLDDLESDDETA